MAKQKKTAPNNNAEELTLEQRVERLEVVLMKYAPKEMRDETSRIISRQGTAENVEPGTV